MSGGGEKENNRHIVSFICLCADTCPVPEGVLKAADAGLVNSGVYTIPLCQELVIQE